MSFRVAVCAGNDVRNVATGGVTMFTQEQARP